MAAKTIQAILVAIVSTKSTRMSSNEYEDSEADPNHGHRDRDRVYGSQFRTRVQGLGIQEVLTAARSPWQKSVHGTPHWHFVMDNKFRFVAILVMWRSKQS